MSCALGRGSIAGRSSGVRGGAAAAAAPPRSTAAAAPAAAARQHRRRAATVTVRAEQQPQQQQQQQRQAGGPEGDFGESVKRIAKRIQGSLPIIGLLSRLASPEGGFDEISYPEFCRATYDSATPAYFDAVAALERAHGKPAAHRALLMVLWMAKYGPGLVPARDVVASARRARVSHDLEVEADRFEGAREAALRKLGSMERPRAAVADQVALAVDGLAALALGLPDGAPIEAGSADAARIAAVVGFAFPEAGADAVARAIAERPARAANAN